MDLVRREHPLYRIIEDGMEWRSPIDVPIRNIGSAFDKHTCDVVAIFASQRPMKRRLAILVARVYVASFSNQQFYKAKVGRSRSNMKQGDAVHGAIGGSCLPVAKKPRGLIHAAILCVLHSFCTARDNGWTGDVYIEGEFGTRQK